MSEKGPESLSARDSARLSARMEGPTSAREGQMEGAAPASSRGSARATPRSARVDAPMSARVSARDPASGVEYNDESDGNGTINPDVLIATVDHSQLDPSSDPLYGTDIYKKGQMHINTDDSTIWVYC